MRIPPPVRAAGQRQAAEQLTDNEGSSSHNFLNSEAASEKSFIRSGRLPEAVEPHTEVSSIRREFMLSRIN